MNFTDSEYIEHYCHFHGDRSGNAGRFSNSMSYTFRVNISRVWLGDIKSGWEVCYEIDEKKLFDIGGSIVLSALYFRDDLFG